MNSKPIYIQKDKFKQLGLAAISLLFVYIGYYMISRDAGTGRMTPVMAHVYGYIGIAFFGSIGLLILFDVFTSKPALKMGQDGLVNNSHFGGGYKISWNNIQSLSIIAVRKQKMIRIDLKEDEEVYKQVNFLSRKLLGVNSRFYGTPAFIPATMLKSELEEVLSVIKHQKKLHSKK